MSEAEQEEPPVMSKEGVDIEGVFPEANRWGHKIRAEQEDDGKLSVNGHISPPVSDGDTFMHSHQGGLVVVYELTDVENCNDPSDMFFASAVAIAYLEGHTPEGGSDD